MDEKTQEMAGRIMAHAFNDEIEKIASKGKMLAAGAGLAAGLGIGGAAGYKLEQKRLSPQERAVVQSAMQQAYKQGNMAMYQRLKSMAERRSRAGSQPAPPTPSEG
jgi:hypothetical protein